jgi:hypothetical protein
MIKIDKFKFIIAVVTGVILTVGLSFNTISILFQRGELVVQNSEDLSKLDSMTNGGYVSISGTPNFLYKVKGGSSNYYFPLKEYGFNVLVRSDRDVSNAGEAQFVGKVQRLRSVEGSAELIEILNTPIDLTELEGVSFTDEQIADIERQAAGNFTEDTFLITFSSRNTLSSEIIVSELFFIFVLSTLGISAVIGGFTYERVRKRTSE